MEIKKITSLQFGQKGIILDNAYDVYCRNRYIEYVNKNQVSYIRSQDTDMRLLSDFNRIEYLSVPEEAEYLSELSC